MHPLTSHAMAAERIRDMQRRAAARQLAAAVQHDDRLSWLRTMSSQLGVTGRGARRSAHERHPSRRPVRLDGCEPDGRLCV